MKFIYKLLPAAILIIPLALQAASKDSAKITFDQSVIVGGTEVPSGEYRVEWEGTGTSVEVNIIQGKKTIATVPATLVEGKTLYDQSIELKQGENDAKIVQAIELKNRALHFDQTNGSPASLLVSKKK